MAKVVETKFRALDGMSKILDRMGKRGEMMGRTIGRAMDRASKRTSHFKSVVGGVLTANIIGKGIGLLRDGVRGLTEEFIGFDHALTSAAIKFPEKIRRGTAAFDELANSARKTGADTQFSATQAAEGLEKFAMAGFDAKTSMLSLPIVVDMATATNADFTLAADAATDALGSFGIKADTVADRVSGITRISNVFSSVVVKTNTDLNGLFETMKDSGPVMAAAESNVETFGATLIGLANASVKNSKAGMVLKNMFARLARPPSEAAKELRKLRIETKLSNGDMRDMFDILGELETKLKKKGSADRLAAIDAIFSKRAVAGVSALLKKGVDNLRQYREELDKSSGASRDMAAEMRKSIQNRLLTLRSSLIELGLKFIDHFGDKIPGAISKLTAAIRGINVKAVVEDVKRLGRAAKDTAVFLADWSPILKGIAVGWAALKIGAMIAGAKGLATAIATVGTAAGGALPFLAALLGPVGAIALAVGGVSAAIFTVIKHWDDLGNAIRWFVDDAISLFDKLLDNKFFTGVALFLAPWLTIPALIIKHWGTLSEFFQELWIDIKRFAKPAVDLIDKLSAPFRFHTIGAGTEKQRAGTFAELQVEQRQKASDKAIAGRFGGFANTKPAEAPNAADERARGVPFLEGNITLAGAPKGTTFETKTRNAPPVRTEVLGANP